MPDQQRPYRRDPEPGGASFKILYQEKFRVTLNTDNRLMSDTTMTREFEAAADTFGLALDDFEKITINAMKSAFLPYRQRCDFIYTSSSLDTRRCGKLYGQGYIAWKQARKLSS